MVFDETTMAVEPEDADEGLDDGPITLDLDGPISLNLGDIDDQPVSIGWHAVTIERCDAGLSKKNLPKLFFLSRITDEGDPSYNRTLIWNCMLVGEGLVFTKRCLQALGLPAVLDYPSYQALADDIVERQCECKVKHETYDQELRARVNNWRAGTPRVGY